MTLINIVPNLCPLQILKLYLDDQLVMVNLGRHENPKSVWVLELDALFMGLSSKAQTMVYNIYSIVCVKSLDFYVFKRY